MKKIIVFILLCCTLTAIFADSHTEAVKKAYYDWCRSIGSARGNPAIVVKYYAPNALLLPTLSPKLLVNKDGGLNDYFKKLTSLPDVACHPKKLITTVYDDFGINTGFYNFTYKGDNGNTITLPARFTFVYREKDNHWWIINHHSSKLPTKH